MDLLKALFLLFSMAFTAQNTQAANLLTLNCDILNEGRFPQSTFKPKDIAIFKLSYAELSNNGKKLDSTKEYRVDFNITASATVGGFKIPFKFNETISVPVRGANDSLLANKEKEVKLPSIQGKLTFNIEAYVANVLERKSKVATCKKTLTIK